MGSCQDTDIDPTWVGYYSFNPLTLKSDQHQISHYIISTESHITVIRIKEKDHQLKKPLIVKQILLTST